jgi:hypothetical protein
MFTAPEEIRFGDAPVVIASGGKAFADDTLTAELKKHIALANTSNLYSLSKADAYDAALTALREDTRRS